MEDVCETVVVLDDEKVEEVLVSEVSVADCDEVVLVLENDVEIVVELMELEVDENVDEEVEVPVRDDEVELFELVLVQEVEVSDSEDVEEEARESEVVDDVNDSEDVVEDVEYNKDVEEDVNDNDDVKDKVDVVLRGSGVVVAVEFAELKDEDVSIAVNVKLDVKRLGVEVVEVEIVVLLVVKVVVKVAVIVVVPKGSKVQTSASAESPWPPSSSILLPDFQTAAACERAGGELLAGETKTHRSSGASHVRPVTQRSSKTFPVASTPP